MPEPRIILVDKADRAIGSAEKQLAHVHGLLHRAFSLFVFNSRGELLLQQRNKGKYHTPGLWSNTCCSHPSPDENLATAIHRRLPEEMGFHCKLNKIFRCYYRLELDNHLIEHENNHICIGFFDGEPSPNPAEVEDWRWRNLADLLHELNGSAQNFTPWFRLIIRDYHLILQDTMKTLATGKQP